MFIRVSRKVLELLSNDKDLTANHSLYYIVVFFLSAKRARYNRYFNEKHAFRLRCSNTHHSYFEVQQKRFTKINTKMPRKREKQECMYAVVGSCLGSGLPFLGDFGQHRISTQEGHHANHDQVFHCRKHVHV